MKISLAAVSLLSLLAGSAYADDNEKRTESSDILTIGILGGSYAWGPLLRVAAE
jgi:hypothetical protein